MASRQHSRRRRRRAVAATTLAAGLSLAACSPSGDAPAPTTTASLTATRRPAMPPRIFAASSFWYRRLPAATPRDPRSDAIVTDLARAATEHGQPGKPNVTIQTGDYTPALVTTRSSDRVVDITARPDCAMHPDVVTQLRGVRVPSDLTPSPGTDGEAAFWDPQTRRYTELWRARRGADGSWTACGGGSIADALASDGRFPFPTGTTATGLAFAGGVVRAEELRRGRIDHVVGVAVPYAALAPAHSWPASRSDGRPGQGYAVLRQGQMLRLPAGLDLESLSLSRTALTLARAAQEHGLVVWDTAGSVSFRAENSSAFLTDPYPQLFGTASGWEALHGAEWAGERPFPLDRLEVLPVDYRAP